jgi:beta-galactosidase
MRADVLAMKQLHINAVRCSHYPNDAYFLDLADRYGLMIFNEANIESHGAGWGNTSMAHRPDWLRAHMERTIAMVERDKNHPSVLVWSLGNEAGNGASFHATFRWIKARDSTRLVQYERAIQDANQVDFSGAYWGRIDLNTDLVVPMYPYPEEIEYYALHNGSMPLVMCEYAHAMGNSLGGFDKYWRIIRRHRSLAGGFIWDWKDQGIASRTMHDKPMWA